MSTKQSKAVIISKCEMPDASRQDPLKFGVVPKLDQHVLHARSPASMNNSDALDRL